MINWKVRINNKAFWIALIPALAVLVKSVAALCGVTLDLDPIVAKLLDVVEAVFVVLAIMGIVNDPTTAGLSDSNRAKTYEKPYKDE